MTLNTASVGKEYTSSPVTVDAKSAVFYALSVADDNPAYLDPRHLGGRMVPPTYAAVYAHDPIAQALRDPEVGIHYPSIVHYAQSFKWHLPVRPGDRLTTEGRIAEIKAYENGSIVVVETTSTNAAGAQVTTGLWSFFDRSAKVKGAGRAPRTDEAAQTTVWRDEVWVRPFQPALYAEASGDFNAIHLDDAAAKARGLPGVILHGFCTMAFCQKLVVNRLCGHEPRRLSKMSLQFSKPVFPGDCLSFQGVECSEGFGMRVMNGKGQPVLRHVLGTFIEE